MRALMGCPSGGRSSESRRVPGAAMSEEEEETRDLRARVRFEEATKATPTTDAATAALSTIAVLFSVAVGIIIRSGLVRQAVRWRLELGERGLLLTGLSIHAHALITNGNSSEKLESLR